MQDNLEFVRHSMEVTQQEIGDYLGLSRQSVSKLENGHTKLSVPQYIALRHLLESYMEQHPQNLVARMAARMVDCESVEHWERVIFLEVGCCI